MNSGTLVAGFNTMLEQLEARDKELTGYRNQLENAVATRTRQLTEAVRDLAKTVDELEFAKRQAENANRTKSQFLANMSHRNPHADQRYCWYD